MKYHVNIDKFLIRLLYLNKENKIYISLIFQQRKENITKIFKNIFSHSFNFLSLLF